MWKVIKTNDDITNFMEIVCNFHDSCIKEICYLSGAYVDNTLSMHPLNNCRALRVLIQSQNKNSSMIEIEFHGLKYLKLFPVDENYTCEILGSTMVLKDNYIYWCDSYNITESDLINYTGTIICASGAQWRTIENHMGKNAFYNPAI